MTWGLHRKARKGTDYFMFWPFDPAKNAIQGDALEGSDTFWWQLREEIAWAEIGWWMGRGKKIPLFSYRLTHRKRVTSELHDSYFRSMTITQAIPKKVEVTHPNHQKLEEIVEAWRRVHITTWEFEGNIRPTNWTEDSWVPELSWVECQLETSCDRESHTRPKGLRLSSYGERERHNADGHNFGVKIFQLCSVSSSLSHAKLEQPFRTLQIKREVNIL